MKKLVFMFAASVTLLSEHIVAGPTQSLEGNCIETVYLDMPKDKRTDWRPAIRELSINSGVMHLIPRDDDLENPSKAIYFFFNEKKYTEVTNIKEIIKESYLPNKVKFIAETDHSVIFESHSIDGEKGVAQHELRMCIKQGPTLYSVSVIKFGTKMTKKEKKDALRMLRNDVSIIRSDIACTLPGWSIFHDLEMHLIFPEKFKDLQGLSYNQLADKYVRAYFASPFHGDPSETYIVSEYLDIMTCKYENSRSIEQLVAKQKSLIQEEAKEADGKVSFVDLKNEGNEAAISFCYPYYTDKTTPLRLMLNGIVRIILTDEYFFIIRYNNSLPERMSSKDVQAYKQHLDGISVTLLTLEDR